MAVDLEIPVRVGGEPVVLVAVEDDARVGADPAGAHQVLELGLLDDVPLDRVLEIVAPVQLDRTGDVSVLVEIRVLVHLRHDQVVVTEVRRQPLGRHQHVGHPASFPQGSRM